MIYTVDYTILNIVLGYVFMMWIIANKYLRDRIQFISFSILAAGITTYSGIGLSYIETESSKYILYYLLFITLFTIGFILSSFFFAYRNKNKKSTVEILINEHSGIVFVLTIIFWITLLFRLIYPIFRLGDLLHPKLVTISTIFAQRYEYRQDMLTYLMNNVNIITLPFFFIQLNKFKKLRYIIISLIMWAYISTIIIGYLARSCAVAYFLLILFSIYEFKTKNGFDKTIFKNRIKALKPVIIGFIIFILCLPFLYQAEFLRTGHTWKNDNSGFEESLLLIQKETDYSKYYYIADTISNRIKPTDYYLWLITLPIPKQIIHIDQQLKINNLFSQYVLNKTENSFGYYILLPSLFGESLILYGKMLCWIHGLFLGFTLGLVSKLLSNIKDFRYYSIYNITFIFLLSTRGGSQYIFSNLINANILLIFILFLIEMLRTKMIIKH